MFVEINDSLRLERRILLAHNQVVQHYHPTLYLGKPTMMIEVWRNGHRFMQYRQINED